jgi:hypothetical protein
MSKNDHRRDSSSDGTSVDRNEHAGNNQGLTAHGASRRWLFVAGGALVLVPVAFIPVNPPSARASDQGPYADPLDLSKFDDAPLGKSTRLLFIHHSCGGQMLADVGEEKELANCIFVSHPNGGNLRRKLEAAGYEVNEASYGSEIGDKTDMFDWLPKFRSKMDRVLSTKQNDIALPQGQKNRVVVFKSCYPQNRFVDEGRAPGNPEGPELTVENAKAHLLALLPEFAKQRDTLFVYVTAPANSPKPEKVPLIKMLLGELRGVTQRKALVKQSQLARRFTAWVVSPDGWLKDYPHKNVVVFDYYDILTNRQGNLSQFPTGDGSDNHPSHEGNQKAALAFVPFLNRAMRRFEV